MPITPYRVLWDLQHTVDVANTIITHDAGSPRDQLSRSGRRPRRTPSWAGARPRSSAMASGLALGAKLACPDKLCINVWGDAAIGFTGMDFETAVRERLPILSILAEQQLHGDGIKCHADRDRDASARPTSEAIMRSSRRRWAAMASAFRRSRTIIPAIKRGIAATEAGKPALLEFMTSQELDFSNDIHRQHKRSRKTSS